MKENSTGIERLISTYRADKRTHSDGSPWVLLNMISSSNGLSTRDGLSGSLGGPEDRELFRFLRSIADVIIVGHGTVRDEMYKPPKLTNGSIELRKAKGQSALPTIAVISNQLELDENIPLFSSDEYRPAIITSSVSPEDLRSYFSLKYDLFVCGEDKVNLKETVKVLSNRFGKVVLVEGGPSLNKQFVACDLFDELCVTTSPFRSDDLHAAVVTTGNSYPLGMMTESRRIEINGFTFTRFLRNRDR